MRGWYKWNRKTDEITPIPDYPPGSEEWLAEMQENEVSLRYPLRHVGDTTVNGFRISTVFLGLDHAFALKTPVGLRTPVLFETMVFGDRSWRDHCCWRYESPAEARAGHQRMLKLARFCFDKAPKCSRNNFTQILGKL